MGNIKFEKSFLEELMLWNSPSGEEICLCMVAQGFKEIVFVKYLTLYGSGFAAIDNIKRLEEQIN